jgi:hypothetical protein
MKKLASPLAIFGYGAIKTVGKVGAVKIIDKIAKPKDCNTDGNLELFRYIVRNAEENCSVVETYIGRDQYFMRASGCDLRKKKP